MRPAVRRSFWCARISATARRENRILSRPTGRRWATEEVKRTKQKLGWPVEPPFFVPQEALARFRESVGRGEKAETEWNGEILRLCAKISRAGP